MTERDIWRLLPFDCGPSGRHFALSDALVRHLRRPTIWWHATDVPTLILGPGQSAPDDGPGAARGTGLRVVRRQAGGTAVYAGPGVLGLDIALPSGHPLADPDVVQAYKWLGAVWAHATRSLGAHPHVVGVAEARAHQQRPAAGNLPVHLACFGTLSPYEVAVAGRKLVGLAQVRRRPGVLFQSGIHLRFDAAGLASLLAPRTSQLLARTLEQVAIGLNEVLPRPVTEDEVIEHFHRSLTSLLPIDLVPGSWTDQELQHAEDYERGRARESMVRATRAM